MRLEYDNILKAGLEELEKDLSKTDFDVIDKYWDCAGIGKIVKIERQPQKSGPIRSEYYNEEVWPIKCIDIYRLDFYMMLSNI